MSQKVSNFCLKCATAGWIEEQGEVYNPQCDQIGQFITVWATFKIPNHQHFGDFLKSFIFSSEKALAIFLDFLSTLGDDCLLKPVVTLIP